MSLLVPALTRAAPTHAQIELVLMLARALRYLFRCSLHVPFALGVQRCGCGAFFFFFLAVSFVQFACSQVNKC